MVAERLRLRILGWQFLENEMSFGGIINDNECIDFIVAHSEKHAHSVAARTIMETFASAVHDGVQLLRRVRLLFHFANASARWVSSAGTRT